MRAAHCLVFPLLLFSCLFISPSLFLAEAQELCVKNSVRPARNGKVRLNRAIIQRDQCPRGFSSLAIPAGDQGPAGEQGPAGPAGLAGADGTQGLAGDNAVVQITTLRFPTDCSTGAYSGRDLIQLCQSSQTFEKLEDDTVLEVLFYGRFVRPNGLVGSAVYHVAVDGTFSSGASGFSGSPGRYVVLSDDAQFPQGSLHSLIQGVAAGSGLRVETYVSGNTLGSSGDSAQIDPGNFGSAYAIVREVRLPPG